MKFEELASRAGEKAARVGRQATRPPASRLLAMQRRRAVVGWSTVTIVVSTALAIVVLTAPAPGTQTPAAVADSTTTSATTVEDSKPIATQADEESCAYTVPGEHAFTPESQAPEAPPSTYQAVWYGTPQLWTMANPDGQVWRGLPLVKGSLVQKTFWWSDDFDIGALDLPDITVTAERLDGSGVILEAGSPGTSGSHPEIGSFMLVGLDFPDPGCWNITAYYKGASLSYVVWVDGN